MAIAWGRWKLFLLAGFVGSAALAVRWMAFFTPTPALQLWSVDWSRGGDPGDCPGSAVADFSRGTGHSIPHPGRNRGLPAVRSRLGTRLPHRGNFASRVVQCHRRSRDVCSVSDWAYFSFVTLTTVGYGDITPARPIARRYSDGEALTGQLYLAVLIARLVAMEVVSWQVEDEPKFGINNHINRRKNVEEEPCRSTDTRRLRLSCRSPRPVCATASGVFNSHGQRSGHQLLRRGSPLAEEADSLPPICS